MGRTKELIDDHFDSVDLVRAYFVQHGWPLPAQQLDQEAFIIEQAQAHMAGTKQYRDDANSTWPSPVEMFEVATDTLYGPYPSTRALRFKVSRLMAMQPSSSLHGPLNKAAEKNFSPASATTTVSRLENGYRYKSEELARKYAVGLAGAYFVKPAWLWGNPNAPSAPDAAWRSTLGHRTMLTGDSVPGWLAPWISAVEIAVSTCSTMDTDLYLSDTLYATMMLETFLNHHHQWIARDPKPWGMLVYFPLAHEAMVRARNLTLGLIPDWMLPNIGIPTQMSGGAVRKRKIVKKKTTARQAKKSAKR